MSGTKAALVVIEPEVKLLDPPKSEVESTVEAMATHCVPFQPKIPKELNEVTALVASQVKVILADVAPFISQYSTLFTLKTPAPISVVLKGPLAGNTGSLPP